ncbi:nonsense-mediated mRNA decay factor SMG5 [Adelges cooleyi]|uniref:nonsense-mediated mRNA decay factor SMG5 n=1 Tax=Adelges cooleyi TaxID=133065 RepID=UPI00217F6A3B|nr:nonsense-mediated mRNA decay factor SMG5 [Adelges cooleyi]
MKKAHNLIAVEPTAEASESIKKLYKSITEVSHFLDDQRGRSLTCKDLFAVNIETQRAKLKNYCERMIFADPLCYGKKAEEILWRKIYHDVYSTAKILKKNNVWSKSEMALLENHFQSGIGCYYHILFKFQAEIKFDKPNIFDFYLLSNDDIDANIVKKDCITLLKKNDKAIQEEAGMKQIIYRCLISLGDLSRYQYELNKLDICYSTACRYYHQALKYKPNYGLPHNQIGRLAVSKDQHLDAIYRYVRCVFSIEPFEGGEKNLILSLQEKSEKINNIFLEKLFIIIDFWYNGKDCFQELDQVYSEIITMLHDMCLNNFKKNNEMLNNNIESCKEENTCKGNISIIKNEEVFKISVIIIACLSKLHQNESKCLPKAELFFFAFMEQLIMQCVNHYLKTLPQLVDPNIDHTKLNRRRRRRGFMKHSSPDSQDWSGDEAESVISPDDESDESEEEILVFDMKGPNDDKSKNESDGSNDSGTSSFNSDKKKNNPKMNLINLPFPEAINLFFNWLNERVKSINPNLPIELLTNTVMFLNYLSQSNIENDYPDFKADQLLLPEEEHLRGMTALYEFKVGLYDNHCFKNEGVIRLMKILHCAKEVASNNVLFTYDSEKKWFSSCNTLKQVEKKTEIDAKRDKQHVMGKLWLRAEVDNLEVKMKYTSRKKKLPTCLVVDTDALINHSLIVKKLVNSTMFVVVVPAIVISALDEQKKLSKEVRLTIRWLEFQLQQGNCNLKSQGIHESRPIKLEALPKLTKEVCHFKHILECCNYFIDECDESNGLLTLITGSNDLLDSQELMKMAKSIKINVEHIQKFQMQLKISKNKG